MILDLRFQLKTVVDEHYEQVKESHKASNAKRKVLSEAKAKYSEKKAAKVRHFGVVSHWLVIILFALFTIFIGLLILC